MKPTKQILAFWITLYHIMKKNWLYFLSPRKSQQRKELNSEKKSVSVDMPLLSSDELVRRQFAHSRFLFFGSFPINRHNRTN